MFASGNTCSSDQRLMVTPPDDTFRMYISSLRVVPDAQTVQLVVVGSKDRLTAITVMIWVVDRAVMRDITRKVAATAIHPRNLCGDPGRRAYLLLGHNHFSFSIQIAV